MLKNLSLTVNGCWVTDHSASRRLDLEFNSATDMKLQWIKVMDFQSCLWVPKQGMSLKSEWYTSTGGWLLPVKSWRHLRTTFVPGVWYTVLKCTIKKLCWIYSTLDETPSTELETLLCKLHMLSAGVASSKSRKNANAKLPTYAWYS